MLSLKTPTAEAIAPISSPRPAPAISPETSPLASRVMDAVRSTIGPQMRRRTITIIATLAAATAMRTASAIRKLKRAEE